MCRLAGEVAGGIGRVRQVYEATCRHAELSRTVTALCSEGSMFRRSFVQKVLCSEGSMFRRLYVQKVLYSEGSMFRRSYVQKVLCSEIIVQKVLCLERTATGDYICQFPLPLGTRRFCNAESTSLPLIQRRKNVVCPVSGILSLNEV